MHTESVIDGGISPREDVYYLRPTVRRDALLIALILEEVARKLAHTGNRMGCEYVGSRAQDYRAYVPTAMREILFARIELGEQEEIRS